MHIKGRSSDLVLVTLSRRNLLTLLRCLDERVGAPSIYKDLDGARIIIKAEEDAEHYNSLDRAEEARGRMGVGPEDVPPSPYI